MLDSKMVVIAGLEIKLESLDRHQIVNAHRNATEIPHNNVETNGETPYSL
jgi:hypothetical protein